MAPPCPELEGPSSFFPLWGPKEPALLAKSLNRTPSTAAGPAAVLFAETTLHPRSRESCWSGERARPLSASPDALPRPEVTGYTDWTLGREEWPLPPQTVLLLERREPTSEKEERERLQGESLLMEKVGCVRWTRN